jgi:hypothetical protein
MSVEASRKAEPIESIKREAIVEIPKSRKGIRFTWNYKKGARRAISEGRYMGRNFRETPIEHCARWLRNYNVKHQIVDGRIDINLLVKPEKEGNYKYHNLFAIAVLQSFLAANEYKKHDVVGEVGNSGRVLLSFYNPFVADETQTLTSRIKDAFKAAVRRKPKIEWQPEHLRSSEEI